MSKIGLEFSLKLIPPQFLKPTPFILPLLKLQEENRMVKWLSQNSSVFDPSFYGRNYVAAHCLRTHHYNSLKVVDSKAWTQTAVARIPNVCQPQFTPIK